MYNSPNNITVTHTHTPTRPTKPSLPRQPVTLFGIPSVSVQNNRLVWGDAQSSSTRSYTPLKILGDGAFGQVLLCDWHGTLPPNTPMPLMQSPSRRPEWAGKRLVAVKRIKREWKRGWEQGWNECQNNKELESLRNIPPHANIIALYDFFILPDAQELYFVFESMEGNLFQLIKTRKGNNLAGGLVSTMFYQILSGLLHIHSAGYFHRDMKPENILVTTIGLYDYTSVSPVPMPHGSFENDVVTVVKIADFGLAREIKSKPPYTDYVSTRWYRAPEIVMRTKDYSNAVDMWALGTIMAELVNLRPLFPGEDNPDQLNRIIQIMGNPSDEYGTDSFNLPVGGGSWPKGMKFARAGGYEFPKVRPKDFYSFFEETIPLSLINCIRSLLRYDPDKRLTSKKCLEHAYLAETLTPVNMPPELKSKLCVWSNYSLPPALNISTSHRTAFYPPGVNGNGRRCLNGLADTDVNGHIGDCVMDVSPQADILADHFTNGNATIISSPLAQEYPSRPQVEPDPVHNGHHIPSQGSKFPRLSFGRKNKWLMFGGDKSHHNQLPPVDETTTLSHSFLKRPQTSSTDKSMQESGIINGSPRKSDDIKKMNKKEAERLQIEAEKERRKLLAKMQREQARAVMQKRSQMMAKASGNDIEWLGGVAPRAGESKIASSGPIRQATGKNTGSTTVGAAAGRYGHQADDNNVATERERDWLPSSERVPKARRRDFDDDHSMSSSDLHSFGRLSTVSHSTVDSDPGPPRVRNRPSLFGINRMASMHSLRASFDDFPSSACSSASYSLDGQLAHDFRIQASVNPSLSPPPMQGLTLSPSVSPTLSPHSPWLPLQTPSDGHYPNQDKSSTHTLHPHLEYGDEHLHPPGSYRPSPSADSTPKSSKSAINPIFNVPLIKPPSLDHLSATPNALPPFSQLEAVAGGEYSPVSPMSFSPPSPERT